MGFSSKHLTVFSPETVNIKKLANLTANTKNYRQITLNTKPHSDPRQTFSNCKLSLSARGVLIISSSRKRFWCPVKHLNLKCHQMVRIKDVVVNERILKCRL